MVRRPGVRPTAASSSRKRCQVGGRKAGDKASSKGAASAGRAGRIMGGRPWAIAMERRVNVHHTDCGRPLISASVELNERLGSYASPPPLSSGWASRHRSSLRSGGG